MVVVRLKSPNSAAERTCVSPQIRSRVIDYIQISLFSLSLYTSSTLNHFIRVAKSENCEVLRRGRGFYKRGGQIRKSTGRVHQSI